MAVLISLFHLHIPSCHRESSLVSLPFILHMGIRSRQCQMIVKLMIYREIERLLIFLGINSCTYRFLLRFIPNRKGSNGIRHLGDIVMNSLTSSLIKALYVRRMSMHLPSSSFNGVLNTPSTSDNLLHEVDGIP